ncbi:SMP-30/gluconolactonase/LRE family protein [Aestuariibius insulae]|uniref:SMP-30/gluconolactonase/LRE family protein n=1 Tax=Aestuariibius insulae TaxID=2058287 RepID=UPI00345F0610
MTHIHDPRPCTLGEGALWHPEREELYWFDILGKSLMTKGGTFQFDHHVSAAGWVDRDTLLIASEVELFTCNFASGECETIVPLEEENEGTRSNDGRADPWGGFWISTMGLNAEPDAGAIYRYYQGELRQLYAPLTIPNAICFSSDRRFAYFTDTPTQIILRVPLEEKDGWPADDPDIWLNLSEENWRPDGAVCDAEGNLWNAQWGGFRVACYAPDGSFQRAVTFPSSQTTCPAFGGPDLTTLFCTSATDGLSETHRAQHPFSGQTFFAPDTAPGQKEHQVEL